MANRHGYAWVPTDGTLCFEVHFSSTVLLRGSDFEDEFIRLLKSFELLYPIPFGNPGVVQFSRETGLDLYDPGLFVAAGSDMLHNHGQPVAASELYSAAFVLDRMAPMSDPAEIERKLRAALALLSQEEGDDPNPEALGSERRLEPLARWEAYEGLAHCFVRLGEPQEALPGFARASESVVEHVDADGDHRRAYRASQYDLANAHFECGDPKRAGEVLDELFERLPETDRAEVHEQIAKDADFAGFLCTAEAKVLFDSGVPAPPEGSK